MKLFLLSIIAYLVGALPIGYIIARLKGISDIRHHGSGTIGATNVARLFGIRYFVVIFLLDAGKAYFLLTLLASDHSIHINNLYFFAAMMLLGNSYSIFLRGSGGKGVATMCGILCALHPCTFLLFFVVWVLILSMTRTVGIASVLAVATIPLYAYFIMFDLLFSLWSLLLFLWILFLHRKNVSAYF